MRLDRHCIHSNICSHIATDTHSDSPRWSSWVTSYSKAPSLSSLFQFTHREFLLYIDLTVFLQFMRAHQTIVNTHASSWTWQSFDSAGCTRAVVISIPHSLKPLSKKRLNSSNSCGDIWQWRLQLLAHSPKVAFFKLAVDSLYIIVPKECWPQNIHM